MTPDFALRTIIVPAMLAMPDTPTDDRALVMLAAIGLQESRLTYRYQMNSGPARGLWQFEKGGAIPGLLKLPSTASRMRALCARHGVVATVAGVFAALPVDDKFACGVARLLLWSDPFPLPGLDEPQKAWALYVRTWRPGKPHPQTWAGFHAQAVAAVRASKGAPS